MTARPVQRRPGRPNTTRFLVPSRRRSAAILWWFLPIVAIGGWFYPYIGFLMLLCMMAPLVVATFRGRYWCGWMCPRGAFLEYIMGRFTRNKPIPTWMRTQQFRIGALIVLMTLMTLQLVKAWPDPMAIGRVFIVLLTVTTLVGIGLALAFKPRTWCTFCPMGTMASWLSHGKKPLTVDASTCKDCSACAKLCPMGLTPHRADKTHADCTKCTICVSRCPQKALAFAPTRPRQPEVIVLEPVRLADTSAGATCAPQPAVCAAPATCVVPESAATTALAASPPVVVVEPVQTEPVVVEPGRTAAVAPNPRAATPAPAAKRHKVEKQPHAQSPAPTGTKHKGRNVRKQQRGTPVTASTRHAQAGNQRRGRKQHRTIKATEAARTPQASSQRRGRTPPAVPPTQQKPSWWRWWRKTSG